MAKKKHQRGSSAADSTTNGSNKSTGGRPQLSATTVTITARDALQPILERLDAIAQEAHLYTQEQRRTAHAANCVKDAQAGSVSAVPFPSAHAHTRLDVFAVTSAVQLHALAGSVAAYGLQLLPSLEDMLKRVTLAVLTPALATAEAWETLAVLATTYRAGAAHAVQEVLESLLREPGVFLLDAPPLVPTWYAEAYVHVLPAAATAANTATAALGGLLVQAEDQHLRLKATVAAQSGDVGMDSHMVARVHTDRAARKLQALVDMIYAAGAYVSVSTLQQAALRHVMEVVEKGVLPCYRTAAEMGEASFGAAAASGFSPTAGNTNSDASSSMILRWAVPAAWHAPCLQLLEAFLLTVRPAVPASLLIAASEAIAVVSARLHRGVPVLVMNVEDESENGESMPTKRAKMDGNAEQASSSSSPVLAAGVAPLPVAHAVGVVVVRLGHLLRVLRHPVVLAPFQPPQLIMEKAKRRVFTMEAESQPAVVLSRDVEAPPAVPSAIKPVSTNINGTATTTAVPAVGSAAGASASTHPPPVMVAQRATPLEEKPSVAETSTTVAAVRRSSAPSPSVAPAAPVKAVATPAPPVVPRTAVAAQDEDYDIPDIVMDD